MMSSAPDRLAQRLARVVILSGSPPATRPTLQRFKPLFLAYGRATMAAI